MKEILKLKQLNRWIINIMDIGFIVLGFYLSFMIKFGLNPPARNISPFIQLIPFIIIFSFIYINIYNLTTIGKKKMMDIGISIILSLILVHITTMALSFMFRGFAFPRSIFAIAFILQGILLFGWKTVLVKITRRIQRLQKIIIVGQKEEREGIAKKILIDEKNSCMIKYMLGEEELDSIKTVIKEVDMLLIAPRVDKKFKNKLITLCLENNKQVYVIPELYEIILLKSKISQFNDVPAFKIESLSLSVEQQFVKRIFDISTSLLMIMLSSPLILISAVLVKVSSKGPVLFTQERLTIDKKTFKLYKFRTMVQDAEKLTGPILATEDDPRITKIGRFMRATRLDELPQLFNVLKGDMSVVGPRPERDFFASQIIKETPDFRYRTNVKAGITGLAQVLGKYTTNPQDKLRYDLLYIRNYSFALDVLLIFRTLQTMLTKASSQGIEEDQSIQELLKKHKYKAFTEIGITDSDKE